VLSIINTGRGPSVVPQNGSVHAIQKQIQHVIKVNDDNKSPPAQQQNQQQRRIILDSDQS